MPTSVETQEHEAREARARDDLDVGAVTEPRPARRGSRGLGPALLAMAGGLLLMAFAASRARETGDDGGFTQVLWEVGLVLIVAPAAVLAACRARAAACGSGWPSPRPRPSS